MSEKPLSKTRHLDLGCGDTPRNPYRRDELHGIDFSPRADISGCEIRKTNVSLQPIPYPDSYFDSVSAYDFFEHVPRILMTADMQSTRFPFVELMNEVWRVLKPNGLLYASTPHFPHKQAFTDPTHVNFITIDTHDYFTRPLLLGRMYGFVGDFTRVRLVGVRPRFEYEPPARTFWKRLQDRLRHMRWLSSRGYTHLIWEFAANK